MSRRFFTSYGTHFYLEPPRAIRRRRKERALRRAVKYLKQNNYWSPLPEDILIEQARRRADNFQVCSCHACGNPRRNFTSCTEERLTFQERKAWVDMKQQYEELYIKIPKKRTGRINGR